MLPYKRVSQRQRLWGRVAGEYKKRREREEAENER